IHSSSGAHALGSPASSTPYQSFQERRSDRRPLHLLPAEKNREPSEGLPQDLRANTKSGRRQFSFNCHSERSEESLIFWALISHSDKQRCFASLNMTALIFRKSLRRNRPAVAENLALLNYMHHFRWNHSLPAAVSGL